MTMTLTCETDSDSIASAQLLQSTHSISLPLAGIYRPAHSDKIENSSGCTRTRLLDYFGPIILRTGAQKLFVVSNEPHRFVCSHLTSILPQFCIEITDPVENLL